MNNQIIHICLIGCGRAGMIHARNYKNKVANAAITAVVDASEDAVKAAAEELGITKYFTDYRHRRSRRRCAYKPAPSDRD